MEIIDEQEALLSNWEVYLALQRYRSREDTQLLISQIPTGTSRNRRAHNQFLANLDNSSLTQLEVWKYLTCTSSPATRIFKLGSDPSVYKVDRLLESGASSDNVEERITKFLEMTRGIPITKAERLQILNLCPTSDVFLFPLIEELEDRLTNEQIDELLSIITETIGVLS